MSNEEDIPEALFLEKLKARADQAKGEYDGKFRLKEDAFGIYIDNKTIESLIYHDTQQIYKDLIAKAVEYAKNSYAARFEAAKILSEHGIVINNETISGVVSGEYPYIRAQAECFVWSQIVECRASLRVINNNARLTTIPVSRFVALHLYDYDLSFEGSDYMLNKKSRIDENDQHVVEFDGETLIAGEVSAINK
ncbi:MAG: hypothetical protein LBP89_07690 [Helicobacteraceae bacterium]|jgi:hypothetical protein|nr:hypothetical protein [Helicobacteraceae bacterium]